ncbi:MAG: hypothetical protein WAT46_02635, partial [Saprospiraceae bacterium]
TQNNYFFWYKPEFKNWIRQRLQKLNRPDLAARLLGEKTPPKENKKEKSDTVQFKPKEKASQNEKRGFFGKKKK